MTRPGTEPWSANPLANSLPINPIYILNKVCLHITQSAEGVEYTDCISKEGEDIPNELLRAFVKYTGAGKYETLTTLRCSGKKRLLTSWL